MKTIALATASLVGPLSLLAPAKSQVETLKDRCAEQERQIKELEKEVDSLHSLLSRNAHHSSQAAPSKNTASTASLPSYKVQKGDSLSRIARKHNTTLAKLINANKGINPNRLSIGQSINLPGASTASQATASKPTPKPASTSKSKSHGTLTTHTVKKGETVYSISRSYKTSVAAILNANDNLDPKRIYAGKKINVPSSGHVASKSSSANKQSTTVAKKTPSKKPAPVAKKKSSPKPAPVAKAPARKQQQVQQVNHTPAEPKVRTVTVNTQMTYGEFATQHGASIDQINELNGLSLSKSTVLAQGSELYVPGTRN